MPAQHLTVFSADLPWHCRWPLACDNNLTCPGCHPAGTDAGCRYCQARTTAGRSAEPRETEVVTVVDLGPLHSDDPRARLARQQPPPPRWYEYSHTATGAEYWLRFLLGEPREFAYVVPRRIACRLFHRHNATCHGRQDHPRGGRS